MTTNGGDNSELSDYYILHNWIKISQYLIKYDIITFFKALFEDSSYKYTVFNAKCKDTWLGLTLHYFSYNITYRYANKCINNLIWYTLYFTLI